MDAYIVSIAKQGLFLVLILSGPPVTAALCVGLFVSILQATTQVQEQTLTFVPKLVAIILILIFLGPLGAIEIMGFARSLFENFYKNIG